MTEIVLDYANRIYDKWVFISAGLLEPKVERKRNSQKGFLSRTFRGPHRDVGRGERVEQSDDSIAQHV